VLRLALRWSLGSGKSFTMRVAGSTRAIAADKVLKLANAAAAVEILLNAIAQDEGERIPDWLDEAEDLAIDALRKESPA